MLELKNRVFVNPNFTSTLQEINKTKLPVRSAYQMAKLLKEIDLKGQLFSEVQQKLIEEYGTKTESGDEYSFEQENLEKFQSEIEELLNTDFEIDYKPIMLPEHLEVTPSQLQAIQDVFDFSSYN